MMKRIVTVIFMLAALLSCEKDDICVDTDTPKLIIRFKSTLNDELLAVDELTVWPEGRDSIYVGISSDSIALPLNVGASGTLYKLAKGDLIDEVQISYTSRDVYISRSCGFIANFDQLSAPEYSTEWIGSVRIDTTTIENEQAAHITIFH
jgi:hypothetical protein